MSEDLQFNSSKLSELKSAFDAYRDSSSGKQNHYPHELRQQCLAAIEAGLDKMEVARVCCLSTKTLGNWQKKALKAEPHSQLRGARELILDVDQKTKRPVTEGMYAEPYNESQCVHVYFRTGISMKIPIAQLSSDLLCQLNGGLLESQHSFVCSGGGQ